MVYCIWYIVCRILIGTYFTICLTPEFWPYQCTRKQYYVTRLSSSLQLGYGVCNGDDNSVGYAIGSDLYWTDLSIGKSTVLFVLGRVCGTYPAQQSTQHHSKTNSAGLTDSDAYIPTPSRRHPPGHMNRYFRVQVGVPPSWCPSAIVPAVFYNLAIVLGRLGWVQMGFNGRVQVWLEWTETASAPATQLSVTVSWYMHKTIRPYRNVLLTTYRGNLTWNVVYGNRYMEICHYTCLNFIEEKLTWKVVYGNMLIYTWTQKCQYILELCYN